MQSIRYILSTNNRSFTILLLLATSIFLQGQASEPDINDANITANCFRKCKKARQKIKGQTAVWKFLATVTAIVEIVILAIGTGEGIMKEEEPNQRAGHKGNFCFDQKAARYDHTSDSLYNPKFYTLEGWRSFGIYGGLSANLLYALTPWVDLTKSDESNGFKIKGFCNKKVGYALSQSMGSFAIPWVITQVIKVVAQRRRPLTYCDTGLQKSLVHYLPATHNGSNILEYNDSNALSNAVYQALHEESDNKLLLHYIKTQIKNKKTEEPLYFNKTSCNTNATYQDSPMPYLCRTPQNIYSKDFVLEVTDPRLSFFSGHTSGFTAVVVMLSYAGANIYLVKRIKNEKKFQGYPQVIAMTLGTVAASVIGVFRVKAKKHFIFDVTMGGLHGMLLSSTILAFKWKEEETEETVSLPIQKN